MAGDDWYRNREWNDRVGAIFEEKLSRARSQKAQYLVIQAGCLAATAPRTALELTDRYLETGDDFHVATAYSIRGTAYTSLGKINEALDAFRCALDWEEEDPHLIGDAWWGYCRLVAEHCIEAEFDNAINVLSRESIQQGGPFPAGIYQWNGCNALIAHDVGDKELARQFALDAIQAAGQESSPFAFHRKLGLVDRRKDTFRLRLEKIATPD